MNEQHANTQPEPAIGEFRPASRLRDGWHIQKADGSWAEIARALQVTAPVGMVMLRLVDDTQTNVPHNREVMCRTATEVRKAARQDGGAR